MAKKVKDCAYCGKSYKASFFGGYSLTLKGKWTLEFCSINCRAKHKKLKNIQVYDRKA